MVHQHSRDLIDNIECDTMIKKNIRYYLHVSTKLKIQDAKNTKTNSAISPSLLLPTLILLFFSKVIFIFSICCCYVKNLQKYLNLNFKFILA